MKKTIITAALALVVMAANATAISYEPTTFKNVPEDLKGIPLTPFCKAIVQGDFNMVKQLIALGEDVNQKSLGKTPAMYAARYNKAEILELLIANGANLKAKSDKLNYTAKKFAIASKAAEALAVIEASEK